MKKIIIALIILAVIGVGTYYIVFSSGSSKTPVYAPVSNVPQAATALSASVEIKNFSFNPSTLTVKAGTKVTWTNNDSVPHTVSSDSGNLLNSVSLSPGQSFSFTFTNSGTTKYHCGIHPMMKAEIIVTN